MTGSGDTIFAPSTAPGRGAVAVFRLSGPQAISVVDRVGGPVPPPRRMSRRRLVDPESGAALDDALVVVFPAPASFTGEDMAELHVHGGRAVRLAVERALSRLADVRPAEPGEFSRRAFLNDRIDLSEAEGILDLVDAETEAQRVQALDQASGGLAQTIEAWRSDLLNVMARLEAYIDFPDEDLPPDLAAQFRRDLSGLSETMAVAVADGSRAERVRDGLRIAILGAPNAGKSTLLNWLADRDVAIVSATAGTTRDVLEVHLDITGYAVTVADTAGLRETPDLVESEGVRRALERAEAADLKLVLVDAAAGAAGQAAVSALIDDDAMAILSKADFAPESRVSAPWRAVSVQTGAGMDGLMEALIAAVAQRVERQGDVALTRSRHRVALQDSADSVARALAAMAEGEPVELVAEDLRMAAQALGRIAGRVDVDEILDRIFAEFCLGK